MVHFVFKAMPIHLSMTTTITTMLNSVWFAVVFGLIASFHNAGTYENGNNSQLHLTLSQYFPICITSVINSKYYSQSYYYIYKYHMM